jgi:hypothetical protein
MSQIMQADVPPVGVGNEAVGQLAKHHTDSGVSKASSAIRNKEVLRTWKQFLSLPGVEVERWQDGWVQRNQPGLMIFGL